MTQRVLITGTSHAGAFKLGWDAVAADYSDIEATYFAVPAPHLWRLATNDENVMGLRHLDNMSQPLKTYFEANPTSVDLKDIDAVIVCGLPWAYEVVLNALSRCDVEGLLETDRSLPWISRSLFDEHYAEVARKRLGRAELWQSLLGDKPTTFVASPRCSEQVLSAQPDEGDETGWQALAPYTSVVSSVLDHIEDSYTAMAGALGAKLAWQPRSTIAPSGLTKDEFSRGSIRIRGVEHPGNDFKHMNQDYGKIAVRETLAKLTA